ncbi:MAG: recombination regulator RecX [Bacteriovoracaceae bacterium]|nr:recombination regulator RecX [Bacteriovoracaceae bacterium]
MQEHYQKFEKPKPKSTAYQYALYLLSGQDYSAFKLKQKLKLKGYEVDEIETTLSLLIEKNYLRESEYKRLLAKRWISKGYSDQMIKRRGEQEALTFDSEELKDWRNESGSQSEDVIEKLVQKKLRGQTIPSDRLAQQKLRDKVTRFLLSKGYGFDEIKRAVQLALKPESHD